MASVDIPRQPQRHPRRHGLQPVVARTVVVAAPVAQRAALSYGDLVGNKGGLTPLLFAAREGNTETVKALLEAGADRSTRSSAGDHTSPLLMATINGHFDLAKLLLEKGASPKLASDAGATPLYATINVQWAAKSLYPQPTAQKQQKTTYLELMEALLKAGADPNARLTKHLWYMSYNFDLLGVNTTGATPFWRAAYGTDVAGDEAAAQVRRRSRRSRRASRLAAASAAMTRRPKTMATRRIRPDCRRFRLADRACIRSTPRQASATAKATPPTRTCTRRMAGSRR